MATKTPTDAVLKRRFPEDPLSSLPILSPNPPDIVSFGSWLTEEHWKELKVD
jgi:hypothetical protein